MPANYVADSRYSAMAGWAMAGYSVAAYRYRYPDEDATGAEIHVFDASFVQVAVFKDYERFSYTRNWYTCDTFELAINRYKIATSYFVEGGYIAYYDGKEWRVGIIKKFTKPLAEAGASSETWVVAGEGLETIFRDRMMVHAWATGDGYDNASSAAETNVRTYINHEVIACTDVDRRITGFSLEAIDGARGGTMTYKARAPTTLAEVVEDHSRFSGLSFKPVWTGYPAGTANRNTFAITTFAGTDRSAEVKLSVSFGSIRSYNYVKSLIDSKNVVYVLGAGSGTTRTLQEVYNGTKPTGINRKETAQNGSDCTSSQQLIDRGKTTLATLTSGEQLEFEYNWRTASYTLGDDFNLGDTISLYVEDLTVTARIVQLVDQYNARDGRKVSLAIGKEFPDLRVVVNTLKTETKANTKR